MKCPKCDGKLNKDGFTKQENQVYKCPSCNYRGTLNSKMGRPKNPPCKICGEISLAKGLCSKHYKQWQRQKNKKLTP